MRHLCAILLAGTLAACAGGEAKPTFAHALLAPAAPTSLPAASLLGMNGKPFSLESLRGKWVWLYFGYTTCPDVCPATLGRLAEAYRHLAAPERVQVVFVSVDPQRDTPAVLARRVGYFHPKFLAATGDRRTLDALTTALGARYAVEPAKSGRPYAVSHSDLVFVLDPQGLAVATYLPDPGIVGLGQDFAAIAPSASGPSR